jgi:hypothetical protein
LKEHISDRKELLKGKTRIALASDANGELMETPTG